MQALSLHISMKKHLKRTLIISILNIIPPASHAGVIMMGTRIIINQEDKFKDVKLRNDGERTELIQVWIDNGEGKFTAGGISTPFVPTPSIFKIKPRSEQTVRINALDTQFTKKHESMYWFNFIQILPTEEKSKNSMEFSIINAVKLFYRPDNLNNTSYEKRDDLNFKYSSYNGNLILENNSPYYVNFSGNLRYGISQECHYNVDGNYIAPFSVKKVNNINKKCEVRTVKYTIINDDGRTVNKEMIVNIK